MRARTITAAIAGGALALTGCAAITSPADTRAFTPTPTPTPTPTVISGTGPSEPFPGMDFPIPRGSQSLALSFTCDGGGSYEIELGDSMAMGQAPLDGTCDGTDDLSWPITTGTRPSLTVRVAEGVAWTAVAQFSTDPFATDASLAADCEAFSYVFSALVNADEGYTRYARIDEAEWTSRVDAAETDLQALAASSTSSIAPALRQLGGLLENSDRVVGSALTPSLETATNPVSRACNANQTPVIIKAEFGG